MTNFTITSLAIIKVNWDELGKSYLDNFVPLLAECIRRSNSEVISAPILQDNVKEEFGLHLPIHTINRLLKTLESENYISSSGDIYALKGEQFNSSSKEAYSLVMYLPNKDKLQTMRFQEVQQSVLHQHEELVKSFISFSMTQFGKELRAEEAEEALISYLREGDLHMLSGTYAVIPKTQSPTKSTRFLMGTFVQHLKDTHSPIFSYLETIVKGHMLANAIFLPQDKGKRQKFRSTEVYFDTTFLMYALGYCGQPRKEPCKELIELLIQAGAQLRCFRHTLHEAENILFALEQRMREGHFKDSYGPSIEYFITKGYRPSDIALFRETLESDLRKLQIWVVDKPKYEARYQIDEEKLDDELAEAFPKVDPRKRDVDSISAIMRLRAREASRQVEDCKALFVTTNAGLARIASDFCRGEYDSYRLAPYPVPPCLTDHALTTMLWLKRPGDLPELPMKGVIAASYAATQPDEYLWQRYMAEIERLEQSNTREYTQDDYLLLKYSTEAHAVLMDKTLGEENAFTTGTVGEILEVVHSRIQGEILVQLERERQLLLEATQAEDTRQARLKIRSQKIAHAISSVVQWGLWILLIVGALFVAPWGPPLSQSPTIRTVGASIAGLLTVFAVINLMYSTPLDTIVKHFEAYIQKKLERWLRNLTQ